MRITMEFDAMDVLDLRSGAAALTAMANTICAPQHATAEQVADTQGSLPFLPPPVPAATAAFGGALYPAPVPAPPSASEIETDSAGTPYDPKVHSSSKARKADGTWRKRRVNGPGDEDDAIVAPPPPAPAAVVVPPTVPPAEPMSLGAMLTKITPLMAGGVLTQQQVMDEIAAMGIANGFGGLTSGDGAARIPELMTRLKVPA